MYHIIDLQFQGYDHAIAAFLIETKDGPVLIETGPYSTFSSLKAGLERHGYQVGDVKHVLLSHIHFDHAGAAWAFAREGATIYVHPFGVAHLQDPTRLVASATMIYGDQMDTLWGKMEAIEAGQLRAMQPEEVVTIGEETFVALHTPGHAKHHIAWQWGATVFTGDAAGVRINNGPVVPPCPPPDIHLEDWKDSIDYLLSKNPSLLVMTHYGEESDPKAHMSELRSVLDDWSLWIKARWESGDTNEEITPKFLAYTANQLRQQGVSELGVNQYEAANPSWMSVAGLVRYWTKKVGSSSG